ncbi:glycosyltransferase family 1 protein [Microbulbifer zhoushanensis]|uniref:glycosyltransferase family 1 protein n=1 Tax=Microbulbifer zhoushanensis TaxID=2904254 RepID=UPI001F25B3BA|nr:glycosyltransferase family 1 protein [Microbulbifer zhoushanensis]
MPGDKRCFVVEEGENPSTDYFVMPFLREQGYTPLRRTFSQLPTAGELQGATVVFVRYLPGPWRALVTQHRAAIAGLYLFMDDDLFDWRAFIGMPLRYQAKLLRLSWRHRGWLRSQGAKLLVSTPYLQSKYAHWQPQLLPARPPEPVLAGAGTAESPPVMTVFYHGSASHGADLRWLRPVIAEVLERNEKLVFEVIGNAAVNRLFRGLPRVHVLHPMKWPTYRALVQRPGRTIGLAPLLDNRFNRARAHTKFFDITLAGAVGVYARGDIYGDIVRDGENGLLVPMEQGAWAEAILRLVDDAALRQRLLEGARACL